MLETGGAIFRRPPRPPSADAEKKPPPKAAAFSRRQMRFAHLPGRSPAAKRRCRYFPVGFADGKPHFKVARGDREGRLLPVGDRQKRAGLPNGARAKHSLATIKQEHPFNFENAKRRFSTGSRSVCSAPKGRFPFRLCR